MAAENRRKQTGELQADVSKVAVRQAVHARRFLQGLVIALFLVTTFSYIARFVSVGNRFDAGPEKSNLVLVALKTIAPRKPPPPPPKTAPPPAVVVKEPEPVPDVIKTKVKPVVVRKRPQVVNPRLDLGNDTEVTDVRAPTLGDFDVAATRRRAGALDLPELRAELGAETGVRHVEGNALSLDFDRTGTPRKEVQPPKSVSLQIETEQAPRAGRSQEEAAPEEDFLNADVTLVLTSSDLSMGVEEYSIWNKINAEFDRWDKGRYGSFPSNLERRGRALIATFAYSDGAVHRVIWLRGNTRLYVLGESHRSRINELKLALSALIHLNTRDGNSQ